MRLISRRARGALAILAAMAVPAAAQDVCRPPDSSNEAGLMAFYAVPLTHQGMWFTPAGGARVIVGGELGWVPSPSEELATPTFCRPGKGPENTDLVPVFARPRVALALANGFFVEASWIPPLELSDTRANILGVAAGWHFPVDERLALALRAHATVGTVTAPITCDEDAVADSTSECFEGTISEDTYQPNVFGGELTGSYSLSARVRGFLGAGYSHLSSRFQVGFTNRVGVTDSTRVEVELDRLTLHGGFLWQTEEGVTATLSAYAQPSDAVTLRLLLAWPFRLGGNRS